MAAPADFEFRECRTPMPVPAEADIVHNLARVRARIEAAARAAGRDPAGIRLLAVSKGVDSARIRLAAQAGQRLFGENYVQEGAAKVEALADLPALEWHFIGPIQRNKTQLVASRFQWAHSLDRVVIAQRLGEQRDASDPMNVLIQVNVSGEASKSGVAPAQIEALADAVLAQPRLRLRGLMALPSPDAAAARLQFQAMADYFQALRRALPDQAIDTLSMGMSEDLEAAIMAGATVVRVGTAIFGPRARRPAHVADGRA